MNFDNMRELIDKLNYYTKLYDEGHPAISDKEWDNMYFQLQELEKKSGVVLSNSPTAKISYQVVNTLQKVEHNHPMLSLDKTKSEEEIVNFLSGHDAIAMAKMDGLTCSIRYLNGTLVSAETRGNGLVGEDITHNIHFVQGVPIRIPSKEKEVIIDGEVICTYDDFDKFSEGYANPRNFAAGSIRLLNSEECANRHLTFVAWDIIKGSSYDTLSSKMLTLSEFGFIFVPYLSLLKGMIDINHIHHAIYLIQEIAKEFSYPIDGIVFKYDNCEYYQSLGYTDHHFRGGIAFKFYDEEYETYLQDIEWSMGKTGQITPVAIFNPVDDGESVITRASLHNLNIMRQLLGVYPYKGQKIWVCKQNQIIPQIVRSEKENYINDLQIPDVCPICGEPTYIKNDFLYCGNSNCEGKFINQLNHFCGKKGLDIKGLSKATLEKLIDWNWIQDFASIYNLNLHKDEWVKKPGFGTASVDKILTSIEKSKHTELWRVIAAAGIPEIGITASKALAQYYKTWEAFRDAIIQGEDFSHIDGFGYVMNNNIHNYDFKIMDNVASHIIFQNDINENKTQLLTGKQFCITGKVYKWNNRDDLKKWIEDHGGKVTGSVTSKTNYLINNDTESTTAKNLTAKKLNIPIISEIDFLALIDDLLAL